MTSPTTEEALRAAQRSDNRSAELRLMLRAGTLTRADVEVCAYAGDEASREVAGDSFLVPPGQRMAWNASFGLWLSSLPAFLARLSPVTVEDVCGQCDAKGVDWSSHSIPTECTCRWSTTPGRRTVTIPAERWWSVFVACTVAEATLGVHPAGECDCPASAGRACKFCDQPREHRAIDAARAWLDDPTEANLAAAHAAQEALREVIDVWSYIQDPKSTMEHAAELIGEQAVREAIRDALIARLLP